ncbi:hypothetical protein HAALTHF_20990n [Vreelandella aquamarina]|nr:hypothetical protein HAALTHF_20990n [Halomonas axialensis]
MENGIVLTAMQPTPLLTDLAHMLQRVEARLGEPAAIIGCDCFFATDGAGVVGAT